MLWYRVCIYWKRSKTVWQAWNVFENATQVFHCLSSPCDNLTQSEIGVLEEFVLIMYDRSSSTNKVKDARIDLFARKHRPYNGIPPSRAALVEHIKRSVLQAGYTWGQSLCKSPTLPSHSRWGWEKDSGVWVPHWTCAVNIYMKWYFYRMLYPFWLIISKEIEMLQKKLENNR
jgi:hypothetical protein